MKKTNVPTIPSPVDAEGAVQNIARLFADVARHTESLADLESADDFDDNPDVVSLRKDKAACLRQIIRLDAANLAAHTDLVEMSLEADAVDETDLRRLEQLNAANPRREVTALIRRARAALAEAHDLHTNDDD